MDFGSQVTMLEKVEVPPTHKHPLLPFTRFVDGYCEACDISGYMYGGYCCNELGCETMFHKECAWGRPSRPVILENSNLHEHPLQRSSFELMDGREDCKMCGWRVDNDKVYYRCNQCDLLFHQGCAEYFPQGNHILHPQHPLKLITWEVAPLHADEMCLLCGNEFEGVRHNCDVCSFSICRYCLINPPPLILVSPTTHEHQLHLVRRRLGFTCNACGEKGDRSPYLCLQCNFMIHRECIDLPRVININRHDHRISYTRRLGGHREWKCRVCHEEIDGFYGGYICGKCPSFAVHSRCATRSDVWDLRELEGLPEEEEEVIPPFEVIDDNTIKHFCHDHNLELIDKDDGHGQPDNIVCEACRLQIFSSEPFYNCKQCDYILHKKCANHPRKIRHMSSNHKFTLHADSLHKIHQCSVCKTFFTGFRYQTTHGGFQNRTIDVRCATISDTLEHESHQHPLYYNIYSFGMFCRRCRQKSHFGFFRCDECYYHLDAKCALFPKRVMKSRYDDHPLILSLGEKNVDGDYWCQACETKLNPKEWSYTCNDCGTTLHITCVLGDFSYIKPGSLSDRWNGQVVSNTSLCRPICAVTNSRCVLPTILKTGVDVYCSLALRERYTCSETEDICSETEDINEDI